MTKRSRGKRHHERHVRIHHWLMETAAWRSLGPVARAALVELYSYYNSQNNGDVFMSVRRLATAIHVSPTTANKALHELVDKGFIRPRQLGSFNWKMRHATTWVLTEFEFYGPPTKDFVRWQPPALLPRSEPESSASGVIADEPSAVAARR